MMNGNANVPAAKTLTLEVTLDEVNMLLGGLGELPAKISLGLINKLQSQASAQLQASEEVVPASELKQ